MKDKYLTYNIEELATDEDFISWVKEGDKSGLWVEWLMNHPGQEKIFDEARSLVEGIGFQSFEVDKDLKQKMWNEIDSATSITTTTTKSRRIFIISSIAAAAIVFIILYSVFTTNDGMIIKTEIGGQELVQLPDNSSVKLNAVSSVQFNEDEFNTERTIRLTGEGFFEVKEGSKFTVETELGNVEVLGTSFNVYARGDSLSVACYTGKVRVFKGSEEVILNPGEEVEIGRSNASLEKAIFAKADTAPAWINGMFTFENERLSVVLDELKRQYNINVKYDDPTIPDQVTGVLFFESGNVDEALNNIAFTEKLKYRWEGKTVVLTR